MGVPVSMNFFSEVLLMVVFVRYRFYMSGLLFLLSFVGSCFSLYLFSNIFHGKAWGKLLFRAVDQREYVLGMLHIVPLFLFVLRGDLLIV